MSLSKNTAVFEVRCDVRVLAGLAAFYSRKGVDVRSKSELGRNALEDFLTTLVENELASEVESSSDALSLLESLGYGSVNRSGRGRRALLESLKVEGLADGPAPEETKVDATKDLIRRAEEALRKKREEGT